MALSLPSLLLSTPTVERNVVSRDFFLARPSLESLALRRRQCDRCPLTCLSAPQGTSSRRPRSLSRELRRSSEDPNIQYTFYALALRILGCLEVYRRLYEPVRRRKNRSRTSRYKSAFLLLLALPPPSFADPPSRRREAPSFRGCSGNRRGSRLPRDRGAPGPSPPPRRATPASC